MHRSRSMAPLTSPIMLLVFVIISLAAGRLGAAITEPALETWYAGLRKPDWTPPNIVFPVAWSLIFVAIGIAAWVVWRSAERSEEHTSELQSLMRISYAVFCLKKKKTEN